MNSKVEWRASERIRRENWHENAFFGVHHDLHAGVIDTDLGAELTPQHLREFLQRVKPDWIQCDCKGHGGYTSWPSSTGPTSPGVKRDALRIYRDVTRELGIRLGVHYSGVRDNAAVQEHPEWARIDAEGKPKPGHTCRTSGYLRERMIPQMIEVIEKYDVDGFWVDGDNWAALPCWCERCRAEYARRTGRSPVPLSASDSDWASWLAFHRDLFVEYVTSYADAVHARKPDCLVCSNWMYTVRQPDDVKAPVDYLSGDYDMNWGADRAAIEARLLDGRGMTWDLMAWGFTRAWPATGQNATSMLKTPTHLCQELAEVVALGGGVMVYDQPRRSGWIAPSHADLISAASEFCRRRQIACFRTSSASEVAVLHCADHFYAHNDPLFNYGTAQQGVEGALHALLETHRSADVLTGSDWLRRRASDYRLVVVPEQTYVPARLADALQDFAASGGHVLLSGAHLAGECGDLVGADPCGPAIEVKPSQCFEGLFLAMDRDAVPLLGPWQPATPREGTQALAHALRHHDLIKDRTQSIVATRRAAGAGAIVAVHAPIFQTYMLGHDPRLRRWIDRLAGALPIRWTIERVEAPPWLELIMRRRDGDLLLNLINRGSCETLSQWRVMTDAVPPIQNVRLRIRCSKAPRALRMLPDDQPIEWWYDDGTADILIPAIGIHDVLQVSGHQG